ncbi:PAS domain S-box protein [Marinifilum sp. RC60d5]|uniref:PAS domain S-box protein n=1 Tax=Marinifilum sp. RC60d5 TaxID=3458414 RepID=UPI0040374A0A
MIDNCASIPEWEVQKFNLKSLKIKDTSMDIEDILCDFSYLSNCSSLFIDFESNTISKVCNIDVSEFINKTAKTFDDLFSELLKKSSSQKQGFIELRSPNGTRTICIPIILRKMVYGFFVYGNYNLESDIEDGVDLNSLTVLSEKAAALNLNRAMRFVKLATSQLNSALNLREQVEKNKEASEEIRLQKTFFENLFENSPEAIIILNNQDRIIRVNREFERLFEYTQAEAEFKYINDLIVPSNFKLEGQDATISAAKGEVVDITTVRQTKSGKQIHVQVLGKPVMLDNDQISVYAIYRNISEHVWNQKRQLIMLEISEILNSSQTSIRMIHRIGKKLAPIIGSGKLFLELIAPDKRGFRAYSLDSPNYENIEFAKSLSFLVLKHKKKYHLKGDEIGELIKENTINVTVVPKMWLGLPLINEGVVLGVFGISSDIDYSDLNPESVKLLELAVVQLAAGVAKKKREIELKMLNTSMEQSPASIVITNREGCIEYVNPKFCQISGYSAKEAIGKNPRFLKSGFTAKEVYVQMWEHLVKGEEWVCEFLNVKKNRELFWERASFSAIKDEYGKITHYVAVKEDITERKKFEKDLLEAKNKAEESDRMKSAFLANVSHELRTPLNAVIGFSNLCNDSMQIDEILEFVQLINKSGNQLFGIIEDILNFTMIESGGMAKSETEFLMINFFEEVKKQAIEKQRLENKDRLELKFTIPANFKKILVKTDFQRLLHVVMNLFKNGLKFTNEGVVEFGYYVSDGSLKLYVKDTGVGIEKDKKDIIFEKFRQVDDTITRTFGGTGMGLAISKKIMDMLGGKIEVESEPNSGSTFTLILDCILSKESIEQEEVKKEDKEYSTILVAEDEISNYRLIEAILKRSKYKVIRAENGAEAIRICKEIKEIDLILMDMRMPEVDGMEATIEIKKFRPNLPIIAQTAYAMNGDKNKVLDFGCDDYISKPIKRELLISKLKSFIK